MSFQVAGDSELYEPAKQAAETWSAATGATITVTPDGVIPIVLVEKLADDCEAGPNARGCSYVVGSPEESWTEIPSSVHWSIRYGVLLHEMGHQLRGTAGHLTGVPHAVMAADRAIGETILLPEDVAFVCSGTRIACPSVTPL